MTVIILTKAHFAIFTQLLAFLQEGGSEVIFACLSRMKVPFNAEQQLSTLSKLSRSVKKLLSSYNFANLVYLLKVAFP